MENEEKKKQDILKKFIEEKTSNPKTEPVDDNVQYFGDNVRKKVDYIPTSLEEQYHNLPLEYLPFNKFYPIGTKMFVRPLKTKEIEAFSVVNENNPYDVHNKLVQVLKECVRLEYLDGTFGNYTDIQFGDMETIIIVLARLTAKKGRKIEKKIKCSCGYENTVEYVPANYVYKEENEDVAPFFDFDKRVYVFPLESGISVKLAPPTIGLSESLNKYIFIEAAKSQQTNVEGKLDYIPNTSFMENITYLKSGLGIKELSPEEWGQEEYEYERMNDELFMFVDETVKMIDFGIKHVKSTCENTTCKKEIKFPFHYPDGTKSLFVVPNAFKQFIRQSV